MDICLVVCYISAAHLRGLSRWKRGRTTNLSVDTVSEVAMNGFSLHGMAPEHRSERLQRNVCMAMGAPA